MYSTLYADDDNDHNDDDDDDDDSRKQKLCRVPLTPPSLSITLSHSFAFGLTFSPSLSILDFCKFAFCAVVSVIVIEYV